MLNLGGVAFYIIGTVGFIGFCWQAYLNGFLAPWFAAAMAPMALVMSRLMARWWPSDKHREPPGATGRHVPFALVAYAANFALARPLMFLIASLLAGWVPIPVSNSLESLPSWMVLVICIFLFEAMGYWQHRMFHAVDFLWKFFHSAHHEPAAFGTFLILRVHYIELFFSQLVRICVLHVIGIDPAIINLLMAIELWMGVMQHTDTSVRFGWVNHFILTPESHIWHHSMVSRVNFGFGIFPFFDKIFGTFFMPRGRDPQQLGVGEWSERSLMDVFSCRLPLHGSRVRDPLEVD